MSWLGDQFNSITGKITDFTKVLNESTSDLSSEVSNQNGILSSKEFVDLCKEKDQKIELLMQEKECLENNIEELDQQHQEAINSLLHLKNQVLAENSTLKEKLDVTKNQNFPTCDFALLSKHLQKVFHSEMGSASLSPDPDCSEKDIDLIMLLELFSNGWDEENLNAKINWLENQKHTLENDTCEEDKDTVNTLINKITDYTNFLKTVSVSPELVFPVINEICSAFKFLVSEIVQLNQKSTSVQPMDDNVEKLNVNICCSKELLDKSTNCNVNEFPKVELKIETCESSIQTNMASSVDSTTQTYSSAIDKSVQNNMEIPCNSRYSQTEKINLEHNNRDIHEEKKLINELQSTIDALEQEKSELQFEVCNLKSSLNKTSESVVTQTDGENIYRCESLKAELDTYKKLCDEMAHKYKTLQKEHSDSLTDLKEKLHSRESVTVEKDSIIQSQKKEVLYLKDKIKSLIGDLNSLKSNNREKESVQMSNNITSHSQGNKEIESSASNVSEIAFLQTKITNLELEKNRLLCVLNEKSQECSSLKSEVHKLTSIVASEKQALFKLQQDNCELKCSNKDNLDPELTKETVRKLSTIIRDKDFEIESLKQKNSTLTTLIQDASNIPEHLQTLLEEKENLAKQINVFKRDREKFMMRYNTKDGECRKYATEVKELGSALSEKREKFDILEQKHVSIVQQYEEKQKSLINTQNEMISLKQRVTDLEQQQVDIKEKYSDLLNKINSDATIQITKEELSDKDTRLEQLTCAVEEKDHLIQEKDCMIHDLSQQVKKLKLESEQQQQTMQSLEKKVTDSMGKVVELKSSVELLHNEKQNMELKFRDKDSESTLLKDMNERLNMALKEKEFAIQSMTEKVSSLSQYINSDHSSSETVDINQILTDSESMFSKAQDLFRERDETLLALNQSKQENQNLRNEIQRMKSNEIHLKNELERLRQHLLEIEETYTNEALKAEEKEKRLQDALVEVRRRAEITSTAVVDTNQRASIQIASLQEQLSIIANQRDTALSQISSLEDEVLQHSTAVGKLQLVLEQMQKGNERKLKEAENKWQLLLEKQKTTCKQLDEKLHDTHRQLEESAQALEAASRLSEQLDAKEEMIYILKSELSKTENKIKSTTQEIDSIKSNTEGKVDRVVMKSLVLGYFSTPPGQKSEVIRLLARVLDFNQEEMERAGIVVGRNPRNQENKGLFSSLFSRLPSLSSSEQVQQQPQKSFTTLFVQFLEHESQPIVPMPFPVERMAQELSLKPHPGKKSQTTQNKSSPRKSPLLLDIESAFPTFTPVPAVEYSASPAPAILKEVLE